MRAAGEDPQQARRRCRPPCAARAIRSGWRSTSTSRSAPSLPARARFSMTAKWCWAAAGSNRVPISDYLAYNIHQEALHVWHVWHVGCPGLSAGDGYPHLPFVPVPLPGLVLARCLRLATAVTMVFVPIPSSISETGVRPALRLRVHLTDGLGSGRPDLPPHVPTPSPQARLKHGARRRGLAAGYALFRTK